jgi:hypothetical protein
MHSSTSTTVELGFGCTFLAQDYYLAIINDDIDRVKSIFDATEEERRDLLLNGDFKHNINETDDENEDKKIKFTKGDISEHIFKQLKVSRPLTLAVAYGSVCVFNFLLEHGADILKADEYGSGIVDLLVIACHTCPNQEDNFLKIYSHMLERVTKSEDRKRLLRTEVEEGLCPFEAAIKLRCYGLFKAILYTEGVFLQTKSHKGKILEHEFDLTAYESGGERCCKSPLNFLDYLCYSEIKSFDRAGILQLPVISEWTKKKVWKYFPWMVLWTLWRLIYPVVFTIYDEEYKKLFYKETCTGKNRTADYLYRMIISNAVDNPQPARQSLFGIANIAMAVPTLFFDITEIILHLTSKWNYVTAYKGVPDQTHFVVDTRVFRVLQFCLACVGLLLAFIQFGLAYNHSTYFILVFCMTVQRVLILFSLLYFAQVFPVVGFFIIGFQQMIIALVQFLMLYFGILVVFWTLFDAIGMYLCKSGGPFTNCNSWVNFYSSFLVVLNMVSISDQECHYVGIILMQIFHMAYIFIIALLIINYLIAVMSSVYGDLGQYKHQVRILYVLALANLIDGRLHWLATKLKMKCLHKASKSFIIKTQEVDGAGCKRHRSGMEYVGLKLVINNQTNKLHAI